MYRLQDSTVSSSTDGTNNTRRNMGLIAAAILDCVNTNLPPHHLPHQSAQEHYIRLFGNFAKVVHYWNKISFLNGVTEYYSTTQLPISHHLENTFRTVYQNQSLFDKLIEMIHAQSPRSPSPIPEELFTSSSSQATTTSMSNDDDDDDDGLESYGEMEEDDDDDD